MCWRMIPRELSHSAYVKQFIDALRYSVPWRWQLLPPPTPAPEFRDDIRDSGHTCWEEPQMDNYAAAMAFLEEDPKVVGIDVKEDSECQVCRLQWHLKELGQTLPVEERAFEVDLTELLFSLGNECSRRKVAWDDILTSVQKKFINSGLSDFSEEAEISDAGSDVDEASGEDKRAPEALIHPSQVNTAGHGENNRSSELVQTEKVVDVEEESADASGRPNFTNPSSENPHPYSMWLASDLTLCLVTQLMIFRHIGSDGSFGHVPDVPLHPPTFTNPQTYMGYQGGTVAPWNHGLPEGGSDTIVGRQRGYIKDGTSALNLVAR
ncbi:hypothetical protein C8J56DRAFT_1051914 [Mycena floridula]|nr:hypothetical protein C8J56DRAFT_1051914 [Mycena floridula]